MKWEKALQKLIGVTTCNIGGRCIGNILDSNQHDRIINI